PATGDVAGVMMKVTLSSVPLPPQVEPEYEMLRMPRARSETGGPLARQLQTAASTSLVNFGAQVNASLLWAAGHLPHLFFASALVALAWLTVRRATHPR
ncbi:MAG: hypothetical protein R6U70_08520, partial [Bacillota bacterium]